MQPPIYFLEPSVGPKRASLIDARRRLDASDIDPEAVKKELKVVRAYSIKNMDRLVRAAKASLSRFEGVRCESARTGAEASGFIAARIAPKKGQKATTAFINNSTTIHEVLPHLAGKMGSALTVVNTYEHEMDLSDLGPKDAYKDFWDIPDMTWSQKWNSFQLGQGGSVFESDDLGAADVGIVSANAVSATGGIYLVQHFQNISKIVRSVDQLFIVVGIDKVVKDDEAAQLQVRAAALFGLENLLTEMLQKGSEAVQGAKGGKKRKVKDARYSPKVPSKIHVIFLDNGRKAALKGKYGELLNCIGCRACAKMCPSFKKNPGRIYRTAKDILFSTFSEGIAYSAKNGLFDCTTCKNCQRICPVEIPLTEYTLMMREEASKAGLSPGAHQKLSSNVDQFGNPYGM